MVGRFGCALVALEDRPWAEMGKSRKELTKNGLARMLEPLKSLGIITEDIRKGDKVKKGYVFQHFEEAFARYLPPEGTSETLQRDNADEMGTSTTFQNATTDPDVADQQCEKPANDGHCSVVADGKEEADERKLPYEVLGAAPAGEPCTICGKGRGVERIRHRARVNLWHRACADRHLAALADPPVKLPELPPDHLDEHGVPLAAHPSPSTNGVPMSPFQIREAANWYEEEAARRRVGLLDQELDRDLRRLLAERGVSPEFIPVEFERVMQIVLAM